ncbi:MAG: glycosyltransferase family 10, partial [Bdellovibrionota bacterium]
MRALALWVTPPYQNDEIFKPESPMNRDDCLAPFTALKKDLERRGWSCHTQDYFLSRSENPTDVLFTDMPPDPVASITCNWNAKAHLLIQECEVVLPRNWNLSLHDQFTSVFTWHPDLIRKGGKYRETNFALSLQAPPIGKPFESRKLCALIAGNKGSAHRHELYSKRIEAIRYFEENAPESFDLYGVGWDQLKHSGLLFKALNKVPAISKKLATKYPSYHGRVKSKVETLQSYKFAICFENAREIPGYVTEKIFDCLMAGCVPVYWGAPDILDRVPKACLIDFRDFKSYDDLHTHMKAFTDQDFAKFLT